MTIPYPKATPPLLLLLLTLALAWQGCRRDEAYQPVPVPKARTVTVRGSAPASAEPRSTMVPKGDGLDYSIRFTVGEPVQVYVRQGDTLVYIPYVTVKDVGDEGELCYFDLTFPPEIDLTLPMTVFGITADANKLIEEEGKVLYTYDVDGGEETWYNVPLIFKQEGYLYSEETPLDLTFSHFGAYLVTHVTNSSAQRFGYYSNLNVVSPKAYNAGALPNGYDQETGQWWYTKMDIETGAPVRSLEYNSRSYGSLSGLEPGETKAVISVLFPVEGADTFDFLSFSLNYYDSETQTPKEVKSESYLEQLGKKYERGRAYHVYLDLDGERLRLKSRSGEDRPNAPLLTFATEKPLTEPIEINLNNNSPFPVYVDLNGDGLRQEDEVIISNQITLQNSEASIYGLPYELTISGQSLTKAIFGPTAYIGYINLTGNLLSKEALDEMYASLPDVSGMKPLNSNQSHFRLLIKGNPGVEESDLLSVGRKGWALDIAVVDEEQPHISFDLNGYEETLTLMLRKYPYASGDVWIDINNDAQMGEDEKIDRFGLTPDTGYTFRPAGIGTVTLYGEIETLAIPESTLIDAIYGNTNSALRNLDVSRQDDLKRLDLEGLKDLEYLSIAYDRYYTNRELYPGGVLDLSDFDRLRAFSCRAAYLDTLLLSDAAPIEYLDLSHCGWSLDVLPLPSPKAKLRTLIISGTSSYGIMGFLKALTDTPELDRLEAIGCYLYSGDIETILGNLPDRTGRTPGMIWLADNPGISDADLSIAAKKNWKADTTDRTGIGLEYPGMGGEEW